MGKTEISYAGKKNHKETQNKGMFLYIHMHILGVWFSLRNIKTITEKLSMTPNTEDHLEECGTRPCSNPVTPACRMDGSCSLLAMVASGASQFCSVAFG